MRGQRRLVDGDFKEQALAGGDDGYGGGYAEALDVMAIIQWLSIHS